MRDVEQAVRRWWLPAVKRAKAGVAVSVAAVVMAAVVGVGLVGGCAAKPTEGYAWGDAYGKDVESIAVPIFENQTYHRDLGIELTEAVLKEVQRRTSWETAPRTRAATVLNGVVSDLSLRRLSRDRDTGLVAELAVTLTVSFEWVDSRTGEVLASRRQLLVGESFVPARGAGEPLEAGRSASVREAAREIVDALRSSW